MTAAHSLIPRAPAQRDSHQHLTGPGPCRAMRHGDGVRISNEQEIQNMLGYTKIQIMGNLGGTPEMKFLPSGDPVVNFSVAVNRRYKDREGNQKEATDLVPRLRLQRRGRSMREASAKGRRDLRRRTPPGAAVRFKTERQGSFRRDHPQHRAFPGLRSHGGSRASGAR